MASKDHIPTRTIEETAKELYTALCHAELMMSAEDFAKLNIEDAMRDLETLMGHTTDEEIRAKTIAFMNSMPNTYGKRDSP